MAGVTPQVAIDNATVQARLHQGDGGAYLWVTNPTRSGQKVAVTLSPDSGSYKAAEDLWGKLDITIDGAQLTVNVPERDAAVIALT